MWEGSLYCRKAPIDGQHALSCLTFQLTRILTLGNRVVPVCLALVCGKEERCVVGVGGQVAPGTVLPRNGWATSTVNVCLRLIPAAISHEPGMPWEVHVISLHR